jgi:transmembrane 9 superfamily protein 2/4
VNNLESVKSSISYEYYSLPFCMSQVPDEIPENLGEILSGDRIETSDYQLRFGKEERCKVLCQRAYTNGEAHLLKKAVTQNYRVNWIVDNLPAATAFKTMVRQRVACVFACVCCVFCVAHFGARRRTHFILYATPCVQETDENGKVKAGTDEKHYEKGFPIGYIGSDGAAYVNNHVRLIILYHKDAEVFKADAARIVGFEVEAFSVDHGDIADPGALAGGKGYVSTCPGANAMPGDSNASTSAATTAKINPQAVVVGHTKKITWTYR